MKEGFVIKNPQKKSLTFPEKMMIIFLDQEKFLNLSFQNIIKKLFHHFIILKIIIVLNLDIIQF